MMLITAITLVFDGGFLFPVTKQLSDMTTEYVASIGSSVQASVPENEINRLTAQIAEQKRELDAREAALREREIASRSFDTSDAADYSTYILSSILFLLTLLIVFNYVMDFARMRTARQLVLERAR